MAEYRSSIVLLLPLLQKTEYPSASTSTTSTVSTHLGESTPKLKDPIGISILAGLFLLSTGPEPEHRAISVCSIVVLFNAVICLWKRVVKGDMDDGKGDDVDDDEDDRAARGDPWTWTPGEEAGDLK